MAKTVISKTVIFMSLILMIGVGFFTTSAFAAQDLQVGVFLPNRSQQAISDHEAKVGRHQDIIMYYEAWGSSDGGNLDVERVQWIINNGSIPMITWEPWAWGADVNNQPEYSLKTIIDGDHDAYIRRYARQIKQLNTTIYMRPMHEMNGDWYPWSGTVNGNSPQQYIKAFRHIVNIFRQENALNAKWVWSPNNSGLPDWNTSSFQSYYPGDNYVDFAGIDGYNFGNMESWSQWESFSQVFDSSYRTIASFTNRPIIISETASTEGGGNKAAWITDAFQKLSSTYPRVSAIIWFDENKESDWRIASSSNSLAAYRAALAVLSDETSPTGSIAINGGAALTNNKEVTLRVQGTDAGGSGVAQMRFMNLGRSWSPWMPFRNSTSWPLPDNNGNRTVLYQLKDNANNVSPQYSDAITFDSKAPWIKTFSPNISSSESNIARFRVEWRGSDALSGIQSYNVKVRPNNSRNFRTIRHNTTSTSLQFRGRAGKTYYFKVVAKDRAGNKQTSIRKTIVPYNEGANIAKKRGFRRKNFPNSNYYKGTIRTSRRRGATIEYKFTGNSVGLITTKNRNLGKARIFIDGKYVKTINAYSRKPKYRQKLFGMSWKNTGSHTLKIVNAGRGNQKRFDIDGIAVGR